MAEAEAEFAAYFAARVSAVRRLAYALCGSWHTADDLAQSTFVKLYPRWRRVRRDTAIDAYVRRILINSYLRGDTMAFAFTSNALPGTPPPTGQAGGLHDRRPGRDDVPLGVDQLIALLMAPAFTLFLMD